MGFQTNISILNDHFDWIEKNPKTFVKAIKYGMNDGTESLVGEHFEYERAVRRGEEFFNPHGHETPEAREARSHYVTVHQARHADVPQVIYTHQNSAWDVYDFQRGVELNVLLRKSNPETYVEIGRDIAKELRRQARELDRVLNDWEAQYAEISKTP